MLLVALGVFRYYCQCLRVPVRYTYYFLILLTKEPLQERNYDTYVLESNTKNLTYVLTTIQNVHTETQIAI
jgi:hypothetical protein